VAAWSPESSPFGVVVSKPLDEASVLGEDALGAVVDPCTVDIANTVRAGSVHRRRSGVPEPMIRGRLLSSSTGRQGNGNARDD
jgi:hypothetical protein